MSLADKFTIVERPTDKPPTVGDLVAWVNSLSPEDRAVAMNAVILYDGGFGIAEKLEWIPANAHFGPGININD